MEKKELNLTLDQFDPPLRHSIAASVRFFKWGGKVRKKIDR